jgi:hypothetical protein
MTDTLNRPWHTTAEGEAAALRAELAEERRLRAAAERRTMNAVAAEDFADFARETAARRADRAEAVARVLLAAADLGRLDGDARSLVDDWVGEFEDDGFTPANAEVPF